MITKVQIAPSILSADFMRLADAIAAMEEAGADWIHVDVMDGHFVPNLTIGPPHVRALKKITHIPLDVHLMISNPEVQLPWYLDAGADLVTAHIEAVQDPISLLNTIRSAGKKAALSINPPTPVEVLRPYISSVDMILVMSVNPGFSGQSFIPSAIDKVATIASWAKEDGVSPHIEVDGGIGVETAPLVTSKGADILVAGNAIFASPDPIAALRALREAGESIQ